MERSGLHPRTLHPSTDLIFVSIAAYRDPQLIPTVADCLAKARYPGHLRFGICWQHGSAEKRPPYEDAERFRILDIPWTQSQGACWARAEAMKLWRGEQWFLQVDSHCRFAADWDDTLIRMMQQSASPKPIMSTYATPFVPGGNEILEGAPLQMALQGFTPEGIPHMRPLPIPNWQALGRPWRARFLSAGFLFTPGRFVEEVPYDPELYFLGEEAAMTLRAFTHGYDLFHPSQTLVWHDYVRRDAVKHWDDHTEEKQSAVAWGERDLHSKDKVRRLLAGEPLEAFGLGAERSIADYEEYAGLSFHHRRAQDYTSRAQEPPNPQADADWAQQIYSWLVRLRIDSNDLAAQDWDDYLLWYIGVHDQHGNEIYRRDLTPAELAAPTLKQPKIVLVCELQSGSAPAQWTVWPVSRSRGWLKKLQGTFAEDDYTILLDEET